MKKLLIALILLTSINSFAALEKCAVVTSDVSNNSDFDGTRYVDVMVGDKIYKSFDLAGFNTLSGYTSGTIEETANNNKRNVAKLVHMIADQEVRLLRLEGKCK